MKIKKTNRNLIHSLIGLVILAGAIYLLLNHRNILTITLYIRFPKLLAFVLVAICTSFTTVTFQTMTQNNLLTPNIIGIDSLYVLFQTLLFFIFNQQAVLHTSPINNFMINVMLTTVLSLFAYQFFSRKFPGRIFVLLMFGLVFNTFADSFTTFLQIIMDPNEYSQVLSRTLTSFNHVNTSLLGITFLITTPCILYLFSKNKELDVIHLGRDHAINLGIAVKREFFFYFLVLTIMTSAVTALVGPTSFLGFLGANITYRLFSTYEHRYLFMGSSLVTLVFILAGQTIVEHVFQTQTTLSVVINFIGGMYFIFLLLKERSEME